jgi:chromosome segregation ATPase
MKHPSHTSRSPGAASVTASGTASGRVPSSERDHQPDIERDEGGLAGRAPERGPDDEHPHDLLARELDLLRREIETLAAAEPADIDERAETVRERYSELLDDYNDDPEALTRIRALGRRIKDLEEAGSLPRSLILRGRSRR